MRVLMVSWEYPPHAVGGLGRHVSGLAVALAAAGHDVVVLTPSKDHQAREELIEGVRVIRSAIDPTLIPFDTQLLGWALALEHALIRRGLALLCDWRPEAVHAHDWLVAHAGIALAEAAGVPLVATIHATEAGRWRGWLTGPISHAVHSIESWLCTRADRLIVCAASMREEVSVLFGLPVDGIDVITNGIDAAAWQVSPRRRHEAQERWRTTGPLVVCVARLEWEKGVHDLIDAIPRLRRRFPGLRVVVAGDGTQRDWLAQETARNRVGRTVRWAGELDQPVVAELLAACDVAVVPSRYEPFGLTVLEAAASGAPLAVSDLGGPAEFVVDGRTGRTFAPGEPSDLADAVTGLLRDRASAKRMARNARAVVRRHHGWADVAARTVEVYADAVRKGPSPAGVELEAPTIPEGNLLGLTT